MKIKRFVVLFLLVCLSISSFCVPAMATGVPMVVISNKSAHAGDTVDLDISLENNPGIVGMGLKVEYDSSILTLIDVKDAGILGETVHNPDKSLCPYILSWASDTAEKNYMVNGTIVTLTFKISENAAVGIYPVTVYCDNIIDVDLQPLEEDFEVSGGGVTVTSEESPDEDRGVVADSITWTYDRSSKILDIEGAIPVDQSLFVASYDKNGKMIDLSIILNETFGMDFKSGTWKLKLFVLNKTMEPQGEASEILT